MVKQLKPDGSSLIKAWLSRLRPLRVDIVGDFAGKELFGILGEALVAHCIRQAGVDYDAGFQLLHAVHAVESFLAKLKERGCNFHLLWIDECDHVCVPRTAEAHAYKYRLTRAVLIQHFNRVASLDTENGAGQSVNHRFPHMKCAAFQSYLAQNPLHFILCSSTRVGDDLSPGYQIAEAGICVAFIDTVEIVSSKIYASIVTPTGSMTPLSVQNSPLSAETDDFQHEAASAIADMQRSHGLTARELITLRALSKVQAADGKQQRGRQDRQDRQDRMSQAAAAFLVHLAILKHCPLSQRSLGSCGEGSGTDHVDALSGTVAKFSDAACEILNGWVDGPFAGADWDAHDLLDGRLLAAVGTLRFGSRGLPAKVLARFSTLAALLHQLGGVDVSGLVLADDLSQDPATHMRRPARVAHPPARPPCSVLPFDHPVLSQFLTKVRLETDRTATDQSLGSSKIFLELGHWHSKKGIGPKPVGNPPDFWQRKRNQRFMAETIAYSASLTGAAGKNIEPEIIVVQKEREEKRKPSDKKQQQQQQSEQPPQQPQQQENSDWRLALRQKAANDNKKKATSDKKKTSSNDKKSGRQKALEEAEALKAKKVEKQSGGVIVAWQDRCREFQAEPSLIKSYYKVHKFFIGLTPVEMSAIGAEVSLYLCHILVGLKQHSAVADPNISRLLAMLWSRTMDTARLPLTREVAKQLAGLAEAFRLPLGIEPIDSLPKRALPFRTELGKELTPLSESKALDFQLQSCGPYLERSFDSAPDPRVPFFHPDAWQRRVLDAIDADKSLFVVAPTSAGKTFISFYAMKKVLQDNDDVLVYVAPTKALVNQIAAEIQARFSKAYAREGHSIWAIHTRDYRVNNPRGCQVLVTVPHVLQIMLLAPANAKGPGSWSRRVKRIIFDEVHCIGQADDGVIWEQLLLLAPCPIIALSATVGNPLDFKDWLEGTQKGKGFELEMIIHSSRYSDLRKFIYDPPARREFRGLAPVQRLPFPGLDSDDPESARFVFVHPVGSMVGRGLNTLHDASLEPRDCLALWHAMKKHQTAGYPLDDSLHPKRHLPPPVKKADVIKWEAALKEHLAKWVADSHSPFDHVREELRGSRFDMLVANGNDSDQAVGSGGRSHKWHDDPDSVFSLILDLRASGALPAILFSYDRDNCQDMLFSLNSRLESAEETFRETDLAWKARVAAFEKWKASEARSRAHKSKVSAKSAQRRGQKDDGAGLTKLDLVREEASVEASPWDGFDPDAPLAEFSFADTVKISNEELAERIQSLGYAGINPVILRALRRGIAVHHAGMNRRYRSVIELLFRKGYLTVVIATGTLALGINMPCKTVVFAGDSVFLTALNYRQGSGRAGRRGFDILGNVVFQGIAPHRALEIMSAKLPDLRGHFPSSCTLLLRLFGLLHGTANSEYAVNAVRSLLTQTRLYLGGPSAQMSIHHHLRFTIEYLRRQHLLSEDGTPLNFSGLVSHLYFTDNAVFAFHSLLKEGYFHKLCANFSTGNHQLATVLTLALVMTHLFCRTPCHRYQDRVWLDEVVKRSPSIVLLPNLPPAAAKVLMGHNAETLRIFQAYVHTYVEQHLAGVEDTELPFTNVRIKPSESVDMEGLLPTNAPTVVRSPFAALSGHTDEFGTIHELCESVRAGVFLDESAIPYIRISPNETDGVPWNAYIYDFFKHGSMEDLKRDNGIKSGDVWFRLQDFSLTLATIVTSLGNFLDPDSDINDADMADVQAGHAVLEEEDTAAAPEDADSGVGVDMGTPSWEKDGESLVNVYRAFCMLQADFDAKFKKVWA